MSFKLYLQEEEEDISPKRAMLELQHAIHDHGYWQSAVHFRSGEMKLDLANGDVDVYIEWAWLDPKKKATISVWEKRPGAGSYNELYIQDLSKDTLREAIDLLLQKLASLSGINIRI